MSFFYYLIHLPFFFFFFLILFFLSLKKEAFSLEKEAFSVLRSCGWSDKVFSFMSSKKRLREEAGNGPSSTSEFK